MRESKLKQVVSDLICKRRLQSCSNSAILIKGDKVTNWTPTVDKEQQLSCLVGGAYPNIFERSVLVTNRQDYFAIRISRPLPIGQIVFIFIHAVAPASLMPARKRSSCCSDAFKAIWPFPVISKNIFARPPRSAVA